MIYDQIVDFTIINAITIQLNPGPEHKTCRSSAQFGSWAVVVPDKHYLRDNRLMTISHLIRKLS